MKRRFISKIGLGLMMLMSISLTISTLHSHHHLEWDHPPDFADTGSCITADTTLCPICGYLLQSDMPDSSQTGHTSFSVEEVIVDILTPANAQSIAGSRERSPPATA